QGSNDVNLEEISCENLSYCFAGKSIMELDVRNESGANIIGLKHADNTYLVNPKPDVILSSNDQLFILGSPEQIKKLKAVLEDTTRL
ncbi:MAG: TrkA C-terminal domain-containing protein, partial [Bacteroidota bacterium]|nr:TrkA C-terminal domain-containing protein [Bacteroidota bacterium]